MSDLSPTVRFTISPSVRTRALDDQLILLDLRHGEYFSLNPTGALVWRAIEGGATLEAVETEAAEWPVPSEERRTMILDLVSQFLDKGFLVRQS